MRTSRSRKTLHADIVQISPETEVRLSELAMPDPWDFEQVYGALHDFARTQSWHPEREDYLVHITTGSARRADLPLLLAESRHLPGRLMQTSPPKRNAAGPGAYAIVDLDLSKYDRIATRFEREQRDALSFLKAGIETRNDGFNRLMERIEKVAVASWAPLLLTGPTGAGKSQLAKRIFALKRTRQQVAGELVEVNCATIRGDGAMSTLSGT